MRDTFSDTMILWTCTVMTAVPYKYMVLLILYNLYSISYTI